MNGIPVATVTPSTSTYLYVHTDSLGVPTVETNSSKTIVWFTYRQPYGIANIAGSPTQNLRFPGQYFDVETYFQYNRYRDYMPDLGRYLEADPIGLAGGTSPYLYAGGSPTVFVDKLGTGTLWQTLNNNEYWSNMYGYAGYIVGAGSFLAYLADAPATTAVLGISAVCLGLEGRLFKYEPLNMLELSLDAALEALLHDSPADFLLNILRAKFLLAPSEPSLGPAPPFPPPPPLDPSGPSGQTQDPICSGFSRPCVIMAPRN
jgi:RHS repeat-associated protein